ncbi:Lrp/AsnC family transcriptional regulator [Rhodosalinus sp.]|uniref:Lrp/AsnC family transcriptional regulator n=1 Tax=Rhodosalinus sp. TaxID=2047741 RepID=UPI0035646F53
MDLTAQDIRLLAALQRDSRLSTAELAEVAGMSPSAAWRRVKRLESAGVIRAWRAEADPRACGLGFQAIVHVQLTRHEPENLSAFIRAMETRPEVMDCFATTGEADYHLRVLCADIDAYNRFLEDFLFRVPGVSSARTNVVLREIKRSATLPL